VDLANKYKENVGIPLQITGVTPNITREKLAPLVDSDLISVRMGIQTGAEDTKKLYNRHHSNEKVEKAVRLINEFKNKIRLPGYDIILDNPWETEDDIIETLMFLSKLPTPYKLMLYSLTLFPGTELYELAKKEGIVKDDLKDVYCKDFGDCKKTYLNKLFFLLNEYTMRGGRISPKMMSLLTNGRLRQLKLNWLLYIMLKVRHLHLTIPIRIKYLLREGWEGIRKGDFSQTHNYFRKFCHKRISSGGLASWNKVVTKFGTEAQWIDS